MQRRLLLCLILAAALTFGTAQSALAWGNGGSSGNGYGTHDWMLDNAIRLAGDKASWIDRNVALQATDDPDTQGVSRHLHVFKTIGVARGGPQKVADEYHALMVAYRAGNYTEASRILGAMSHYYTDINQPFHTYYKPSSTYQTGYRGKATIIAIHTDYESRTRYVSDEFGSDLLVARARQPVSDVRTMAVLSAKYARARAPKLLTSFAKTGSVKGGDARQVTREVMSRAINDLADIICAIPEGKGLAPVPTGMKQVMSQPYYYYPRKEQHIRTHVYCVDAAGKPMEGVKVVFTWPSADAGSSRSFTAYSDVNGMAYNWQYVQTRGWMKAFPMSASVVSSGEATTSATQYVQSPKLATGSAGVKTTLSTTRPARYTTVKARAKFVSAKGKPVGGLPVTFTWYHKTKTYKYKTVTDSDGIARCSRNIGGATRGYTVWVKAQTYCGGQTRYSRAAFTPR